MAKDKTRRTLNQANKTSQNSSAENITKCKISSGISSTVTKNPGLDDIAVKIPPRVYIQSSPSSLFDAGTPTLQPTSSCTSPPLHSRRGVFRDRIGRSERSGCTGAARPVLWVFHTLSIRRYYCLLRMHRSASCSIGLSGRQPSLCRRRTINLPGWYCANSSVITPIAPYRTNTALKPTTNAWSKNACSTANSFRRKKQKMKKSRYIVFDRTHF